MKRNLYVLVGCLIIVLPLLLAQVWKNKQASKVIPPPSPKKVYVKPFVDAKFQSVLTDYENKMDALMLASGTPGSAIAIVKDSTIVYLKGFGIKSVLGKDSIDINSVFRIASVSKCFASFLTAILVKEGTLSWDDKVIDHLPGFTLKSPEQTKLLTIRHVLSQTTGLPYHTYTNLVEEGIELSTLLEKLKDVNLYADVGKEYSYQNVAYSIIGKVIESATGKPYETVMQDKVFTPLYMQHASMDYTSLMTNSNIAKPHTPRRKRWMPASINNTYYNVAPAGGVNASISDMANWMIALLGNRKEIIPPEMLTQVFAPQIEARSKNRNYGRTQKLVNSYYGLGWRVLYYSNDTIMYHGGYVNGYRSEVAISTHDNIAICLLANGPGVVADTGIPLFFNLLKTQRDSLVYNESSANLRR